MTDPIEEDPGPGALAEAEALAWEGGRLELLAVGNDYRRSTRRAHVSRVVRWDPSVVLHILPKGRDVSSIVSRTSCRQKNSIKL